MSNFEELFFIQDELREKISKIIPIPPNKQHFLNWTMKSYDNTVMFTFILQQKCLFFSLIYEILDNFKRT